MLKAIKKLKLKTYELIFIIAGLGILASLPWIETEGFFIWVFANVLYFAGVLFFVINIIKQKS